MGFEYRVFYVGDVREAFEAHAKEVFPALEKKVPPRPCFPRRFSLERKGGGLARFSSSLGLEFSVCDAVPETRSARLPAQYSW